MFSIFIKIFTTHISMFFMVSSDAVKRRIVHQPTISHSKNKSSQSVSQSRQSWPEEEIRPLRWTLRHEENGKTVGGKRREGSNLRSQTTDRLMQVREANTSIDLSMLFFIPLVKREVSHLGPWSYQSLSSTSLHHQTSNTGHMVQKVRTLPESKTHTCT